MIPSVLPAGLVRAGLSFFHILASDVKQMSNKKADFLKIFGSIAKGRQKNTEDVPLGHLRRFGLLV